MSYFGVCDNSACGRIRWTNTAAHINTTRCQCQARMDRQSIPLFVPVEGLEEEGLHQSIQQKIIVWQNHETSNDCIPKIPKIPHNVKKSVVHLRFLKPSEKRRSTCNSRGVYDDHGHAFLVCGRASGDKQSPHSRFGRLSQANN